MKGKRDKSILALALLGVLAALEVGAVARDHAAGSRASHSPGPRGGTDETRVSLRERWGHTDRKVGKMLKLRQLFVALAGTIVLVTAVPALGLAAAPVVNVHVSFTSDPYDDNWCGIDGTSVDRVVAHYKEDASGASILNLNITALFTATGSGKSMEIRQTGVRKAGAPIDNGDGTYSIIATNSGQSPTFKLPNGPVIVLSVGLVEFLVTFDIATGEFVSFEVLREKGQHPPGCALIVAALT